MKDQKFKCIENLEDNKGKQCFTKNQIYHNVEHYDEELIKFIDDNGDYHYIADEWGKYFTPILTELTLINSEGQPMKIELTAYFKCKSESMTEFFKVTTPSGDCQRVVNHHFELGEEWGFIPNYSLSVEDISNMDMVDESYFIDAVLSTMGFLATLVDIPVIQKQGETIKDEYHLSRELKALSAKPTFPDNVSIQDLMTLEGEQP